MHFVYLLFSVCHKLELRENIEQVTIKFLKIKQILLFVENYVPHQLTDWKVNKSVICDRSSYKNTCELKLFTDLFRIIMWRKTFRVKSAIESIFTPKSWIAFQLFTQQTVKFKGWS